MNHLGARLFTVQTAQNHGSIEVLPESGEVVCRIPRFPLAPGHYTISIGAGAQGQTIDVLEQALGFEVHHTDVFGTGVLLLAQHSLVDSKWGIFQAWLGVIGTFYTEKYRPMLERFQNSFMDDFEHPLAINLDEGEVKGAGGGMYFGNSKTHNVIQKIKENMGDTIIISDIDIQFFQPVIPAVKEALESCDMAFQKEYESSGVNIGFFGLRCNETTLAFGKRFKIW